jgi:hypothetical protein
MSQSPQRMRFPSPLAGEGGSRGGNPSAIRERGPSLTGIAIRLPRSLGYCLRSHTLSRKGRGEESSRFPLQSSLAS